MSGGTVGGPGEGYDNVLKQLQGQQTQAQQKGEAASKKEKSSGWISGVKKSVRHLGREIKRTFIGKHREVADRAGSAARPLSETPQPQPRGPTSQHSFRVGPPPESSYGELRYVRDALQDGNSPYGELRYVRDALQDGNSPYGELRYVSEDSSKVPDDSSQSVDDQISHDISDEDCLREMEKSGDKYMLRSYTDPKGDVKYKLTSQLRSGQLANRNIVKSFEDGKWVFKINKGHSGIGARSFDSLADLQKAIDKINSRSAS